MNTQPKYIYTDKDIEQLKDMDAEEVMLLLSSIKEYYIHGELLPEDIKGTEVTYAEAQYNAEKFRVAIDKAIDIIGNQPTGKYYVETVYIAPTEDPSTEVDYCHIGPATIEMEEADGNNCVGSHDFFKFNLYSSLEDAISNAGFIADKIEFYDLNKSEMTIANKIVKSLMGDKKYLRKFGRYDTIEWCQWNGDNFVELQVFLNKHLKDDPKIWLARDEKGKAASVYIDTIYSHYSFGRTKIGDYVFFAKSCLGNVVNRTISQKDLCKFVKVGTEKISGSTGSAILKDGAFDTLYAMAAPYERTR